MVSRPINLVLMIYKKQLTEMIVRLLHRKKLVKVVITLNILLNCMRSFSSSKMKVNYKLLNLMDRILTNLTRKILKKRLKIF